MSAFSPVMLVHGADDNRKIWEPVMSQLGGRGIDSVAEDYPWGRPGDPTWSARHSAGQLVARNIGHARPTVCVAHSFGCLALLEALVAIEPDRRPASVVLVAPFYLPRTEPVTWDLVDRTRVEFAQLLRRAVVSRSQALGRAISDESATLIADKLNSAINPLGFIALFSSFVLLRERDLESINSAVEVITAEDDPGLATADRRRELVDRLHARLTMIKGGDHFLHYNNPTLIVEAILHEHHSSMKAEEIA